MDAYHPENGGLIPRLITAKEAGGCTLTSIIDLRQRTGRLLRSEGTLLSRVIVRHNVAMHRLGWPDLTAVDDGVRSKRPNESAAPPGFLDPPAPAVGRLLRSQGTLLSRLIAGHNAAMHRLGWTELTVVDDSVRSKQPNESAAAQGLIDPPTPTSRSRPDRMARSAKVL